MTLGGFIQGDRRLVAHEKVVRRQNRLRRGTSVWKAYEEALEAEEVRHEAIRGQRRPDSEPDKTRPEE